MNNRHSENKKGRYRKGRKHSEETRRKMSEAHKRYHEEKRLGQHRSVSNPEEGYRLLITAVIKSAIKDNDAGFFNTETGRCCCDAVGVNPDKMLKKNAFHITPCTGADSFEQYKLL